MLKGIFIAFLFTIGALLTTNVLVTPKVPVHAQGHEPWPPFVMVFEDWRDDGSSNPSVQVARLDYKGKQNWRIETLEHSNWPEAVGSWSEYDGVTLRSYNAPFQDLSSRDVSMERGFYVPADWLVPGKAAYIRANPGWKNWTIEAVADPNFVTLKQRLDIPCPVEGSCAKSFKTTEVTMKVRMDYDIPVGFEQIEDGHVVRRVTVRTMNINKKSPS